MVILTYRDPSIHGFRRATTPRSVLGDYHEQEPGSDYKEGGGIPREVSGHHEAGFRVSQPCQATRRPSGEPMPFDRVSKLGATNLL